MTRKTITRATELREFGITLGYLAAYAGRSLGYVKQWSSGYDVSAYLDNAATTLIEKRKQELVSGDVSK